MPSRRSAVIGLVATLVLGLVVLLIAGATQGSRVTASDGVLAVYPVAPLAPGSEACQSPIALSDPVTHVRVHVGTFGDAGPPLEVTLHNPDGALVLGDGRVLAGWHDNGAPREVPVGRIAPDQEVSVCVRNAGLTNTAYVYGDIDTASFIGKLGVRPTVSTSSATVDGEGIPGDLAVEFTSPEARSLLTRLPAAFRHASVFRPGGVGAWTYWVLIALVAIGAPLALARALVRAGDDDADPPLPSTPSS